MHKYHLPTEKLSPFVNRFYEIDIPHPSTFNENRIIPMGTGIITFVTRGNPLIENIEGIFKFPNYALSGQCFPTFSFECNTPLTFYGISLKPTATYKMFNVYIANILNDFIPLEEIIGDEAEQTRHKLLQTNSTEERFSILSDFMLKLCPAETPYMHLDVLVDLIYQKQGMLKVQELCEHEDVSRRYLEKQFKKFIGFSPGQFIKQVRFNFACTQLAECSDHVDDILMKFGYFDRSHFMKYFKKCFGDDLSVLYGENNNLFKTVFSRILRSDVENTFHPKN
ncbi:MAG: helix-turn-helix domain-containing protein [Balneolaceae bacterium]